MKMKRFKIDQRNATYLAKDLIKEINIKTKEMPRNIKISTSLNKLAEQILITFLKMNKKYLDGLMMTW